MFLVIKKLFSWSGNERSEHHGINRSTECLPNLGASGTERGGLMEIKNIAHHLVLGIQSRWPLQSLPCSTPERNSGARESGPLWWDPCKVRTPGIQGRKSGPLWMVGPLQKSGPQRFRVKVRTLVKGWDPCEVRALNSGWRSGPLWRVRPFLRSQDPQAKAPCALGKLAQLALRWTFWGGGNFMTQFLASSHT